MKLTLLAKHLGFQPPLALLRFRTHACSEDFFRYYTY